MPPPAKIMTNNINNKSTLNLPNAPLIASFSSVSNTNAPPPNHPILLTFASAHSDVATLKTTLHTLRLDYLALETEMRDRMDEYVAARDEAKNWEKRCVEAEERENSNFAVFEKGLRAQNERLARRRWAVWRRQDEEVGILGDRKESIGWVGWESEMGRWKRVAKRKLGRLRLRERCGLI